MSYNPLWDNPASSFVPSVGANNNVDLQSAGSLIISTPLLAVFNITGIIGYGVDRTPLYIHNATGQTMTINHNSGSSSAGNRIITATGADVAFTSGKTATLLYDSANSLWRLVQ